MTKIWYNGNSVIKFVYEAPHSLSITYLNSEGTESSVRTTVKKNCAKILSCIQVASDTFGNISGVDFIV